MLTGSPVRWDFTVTRSAHCGLFCSSYTLEMALKLAERGGKVVGSSIFSPKNQMFMGLRARILSWNCSFDINDMVIASLFYDMYLLN